MNTFLVQVGIGGGYSTIEKGSYTNKHWRGRAEGDISSKRRSENIYNMYHGIVEPGDQLVIYCASRVPDRTHKQRLAFSVIVSKVSPDRTTFEVEKPQFFKNPLQLMDIREHVKQGKLNECFDYCGNPRYQGFNITKLEPTAVKQLFDLVKP